MAKALGWFVAVAFGALVGMGIVYAVSEGVDSRTEYRTEQ